MTRGPPGRSTRATSRSTATGCCRYWIDTQTVAASTLASARGSFVSRLRFCTNQRVSRGLAASSVAFMPWPITSAYSISGGKWLTQLLIRSSKTPPAGKIRR